MESLDETSIRIYENQSREAPALIKSQGKYYIITSGCTGWDPNMALYAVADSVFGEWTMSGNPCTGLDNELTFHSQSSFLLPLTNQGDRFIYMADRWSKTTLEESAYVWLPGKISDGQMEVKWFNLWNLSETLF